MHRAIHKAVGHAVRTVLSYGDKELINELYQALLLLEFDDLASILEPYK